MNPDKDDEWLKLADAIADMEIDTKIDIPKPKKLSPLYISEDGGKEIEAIWIDELADEDIAEVVEDASEHQEENALVKINSLIGTERFSEFFIYHQPGSVTVKNDDGSFSKKRALGGERFLIKRAYKGKKSTIFVFDVEGWKGKSAELSKFDASRYLTGFDSWYDKLMGEHGDRVLTEAKKPAVVVEKEASERYEAQGDTNFGSW
ncbi:hypothetical protein UFOVP26_14 [uncultured Caudovirales phage]|uniref:Uncharacterized protein n=1 Tax=uncultured Caudovirales phage TaxID=2100421 RepID=A0A6J5KJK0_9CAUD|nr:hypothetical protein UFOVP26_14 [uncultured Caudovirales phage]CAB4123903.1 hypothetical protein UFOVP44_83 [uncultured Caudovirales phage]CAB5219382.1 hypothetical protein UFOVP220_74 [uncultured Caudovirales phage]